MKPLEVGDKAPAISGMDQEGRTVSLANYRGRKLVLYFYPKDDTPGCTAEACSLRDAHAELRASGYEVLGVSADDMRSHQRFAAKYQLPFRLLADVDRTVVNAYGVWGLKKFMGREFMGVHRTTFIIDEQGRIERVIRDVDTAGHAQQVLGVPVPPTRPAKKGVKKSGPSTRGAVTKRTAKAIGSARKVVRSGAGTTASKARKTANTTSTSRSPNNAGPRGPRKKAKARSTSTVPASRSSKTTGAGKKAAARPSASPKDRAVARAASTTARKSAKGNSTKRSTRSGRA